MGNTAELAAARRRSEQAVCKWVALAAERGLRGYFQRHGSARLLWQEIRRTLRGGAHAPSLTNFGWSQEHWELPGGDCVIVDPTLAIRVEALLRRRRPGPRPQVSPAHDWYGQLTASLGLHP